jgi:hypothetical protein
MLKALLPDSTITSNTIIPIGSLTIEGHKLRIYEFDVSLHIIYLLRLYWRSYRNPVASLSSLTNKIFLPQLSLAFEYQGEHHYSSNFFASSEVSQKRDQAKRNFASQLGITLISIPYWWNRSSDSLASTIQYYRPDIHFPNHVLKDTPPIPLEMPLTSKKRD